MVQATFRHGNPVMIDYTPSSGNVAAGTIVLFGNTAGICTLVSHKDITNNTQGTMAAGGGVYDVVNLNNAANGAKVWFDGTSKVTTVSTNNALFGFIAANGGGGANSTCRALHQPYV